MSPRRHRRTGGPPPAGAQPARDAGAFAWPSRAKAEARAAGARRRADEALSRLRARQQQTRALATEVPGAAPPTPESTPAPRVKPAPVPQPDPAPAPQAGPPTEPQADPSPRRPHPWEQEFDALAERLVEGLRRDLGPARRA